MNSHGLTRENLVATLPPALQKDPSAVALAEAMADLLARRRSEIEQLRIYPVIDQLDEQLLDILAYDFKVDWWDPDYSLEEKRRTLKGSWKVHKTLGTRAAIETALRAIYPVSTAEPWFQYGGEPYHFRIRIDLTAEMWEEGKPWRAMELVRYYQSLRDHLDKIEYTLSLPPAILHVGGGTGADASIGIPLEPDTYDFRNTLRTGGSFGSRQKLGMRQEADAYRFRKSVRAGGRFAARADLPVPEDAATPPSTTILRTGGVCTILSNLPPTEGD